MVFLGEKESRTALVLGFLATALWTQNVDAQTPDVRSASFIVPGCQKFLSNRSENLLQQGRCFGIIETLLVMGQLKGVAPEFTFCPAPEVATGQLIRVAVDYIERRPQRMREDFLLLALEASMRRGHASERQLGFVHLVAACQLRISRDGRAR